MSDARTLFGSWLPWAMPGFEARAGQLDMALAVERALKQGRHAVLEAGTGTGKTLAYLGPALLSGHTVVVSTATKALQDQIVDKDAPALLRLLRERGVHGSVLRMKGLSNYVCRRRLQAMRATSADPVYDRIATWLDAGTDQHAGDIDAASFATDRREVWDAVRTSSDTRIGTPCEHYESCVVTKLRRAAEGATVLVVNHHLLCADLAMRASAAGDHAAVLPAYDAVIVDEAHHLEDVATSFFGLRVGMGQLKRLAEELSRAPENKLQTFSEALKNRLEAYSDAWRELYAGHGSFDVVSTHVPDARITTELSQVLLAIGASAPGEKESPVAASLRERAVRLRGSLDGVHQGIAGADASYVHSVDISDKDIALSARPVDVGPRLRDTLFGASHSVVLTSATLSTRSRPPRASEGESAPSAFAYVKARIGLDDAEELRVPSPFDVAGQSLLYVPSDLPDPRAAGANEAVYKRTTELIKASRGGALVLCTSIAQTRAMAAALRRAGPWPLWAQGDGSKSDLLEKFRAAGSGVLVATRGFWEGVDVPGDALRLVVMDRIPFPVPTDPLFRARSEAMEREGKSSFSHHSLPLASLGLRQGFGRLLRSSSDWGVVAILDTRLRSASYGRALLAALPEAPTTDSLADVQSLFLSRQG